MNARTKLRPNPPRPSQVRGHAKMALLWAACAAAAVIVFSVWFTAHTVKSAYMAREAPLFARANAAYAELERAHHEAIVNASEHSQDEERGAMARLLGVVCPQVKYMGPGRDADAEAMFRSIYDRIVDRDWYNRPRLVRAMDEAAKQVCFGDSHGISLASWQEAGITPADEIRARGAAQCEEKHSVFICRLAFSTSWLSRVI